MLGSIHFNSGILNWTDVAPQIYDRMKPSQLYNSYETKVRSSNILKSESEEEPLIDTQSGFLARVTVSHPTLNHAEYIE
jgi:hypothetical protein